MSRKQLLEAMVQAGERRAELVQVAYEAPNREAAVQAVTELLGFDDSFYAGIVLDMQLSSFTAEHRRTLAAEIREEETDPSERRPVDT